MSGAWVLGLGLLAVPCLIFGATATEQKLFAAARSGDIRTVRALLAQKAPQKVDANAHDTDGSTPLIYAAEADKAEILDALLAAGADAKAQTRFGISALYMAANNGNAAVMEKLIKAGADPNGSTHEGQTILMTAARSGKVDAVKLLLANHVDVNALEPWRGQTALMWAAAEGNVPAIDMLVEFGAKVNVRSKRGFTPFLFAVRNGHIEACKTLLAHGANVNDVAPDGTSALAMAAMNAYYELGTVLLDKGADPNLPDPRGSALHIIAWIRRHGSNASAGAGGAPIGPPIPQGNVDSLDFARALLKHGINANTRINWKEIKYHRDFGQVRLPQDIPIGRKYMSYVGATAFYVAAQNGDAAYMKVLADGGADTKMGTTMGVSPLMAAAGIGYWDGESPGPYAGCPEPERLEAVKLAIALGNDLNYHSQFGDYPMMGDPMGMLMNYPDNISNMPDNVLGDPRWTGSTALHGAIVSGQLSIVQYLVEHGAQIDAKNRLGWTPLMLADGIFVSNTKKEFPETAKYLRQVMTERGMNPPPPGDAAKVSPSN
jgi:ankyrin repeat protein